MEEQQILNRGSLCKACHKNDLAILMPKHKFYASTSELKSCAKSFIVKPTYETNTICYAYFAYQGRYDFLQWFRIFICLLCRYWSAVNFVIDKPELLPVGCFWLLECSCKIAVYWLPLLPFSHPKHEMFDYIHVSV